jgi:predicted DNA-binding transcriptional regulator YafY
MTAKKLAQELEVSQRTVYRDIDALCTAGVPIYAEHGHGGGYALLDSYRTNLTGLTEDEVRALFMLSIPAPLNELGVSHTLKNALLKLSAALPAAQRGDEERVRQRFHLDSAWWFQSEGPVPHLQTIQQAVWEDRKLLLAYRMPFIDVVVEQGADPYGLVAKAGVWYLVCARSERVRAYPLARLSGVRILDESFERPTDFDLVTFWKAWCAEYEKQRAYYNVTLRITPDFISELPEFFGEGARIAIDQARPPDDGGRITLELAFDSFHDARHRILGLGRSVEVLEPEALRKSVLDFATQIVALYTQADATVRT